MLTKKAYSESQIMDILNDYIVRHPNEFDESVVQNRLKNGPRMNVDQMVAFVHERLKREKMMGLPGYQKAGLGVAAGFEDTAAGLTRILAKLPSSTLRQINQDVQRSRKELDQDFKISNPSASQKALKGIAGIGSAIALPGVGEDILGATAIKGAAKIAPGALEKAAEILSKAPGYAKLAGRAAKSVPQGAAVGAISANPDKSLTQASTVGAISAPIGSVAGDTIASIPSALRNLIGTKATPEQIESNLSQFGKGETMLAGDIADSSTLKDVQSSMLAGASPKQVQLMNKVITQRVNEAGDIAKKFGAEKPEEDPEKALIDLAEKNFSLATNKKNKLYAKRDKLAQDSPEFNVTFKNVREVANKYVNDINASSDEFGEFSDSSFVNKMAKFALKEDSKSLRNGKSNLTTIQTKRKELDGLASSEKDIYKKSAYQALSKALGKDLNDSLAASGNKELVNAQNEADDYFKNHFALYRDSEIEPFLNDKKDFRNIFTAMVKEGKVQSPERIDELLEATSKETGDKESSRNIVLQNLFSKAIDKDANGKMVANPSKMTAIYNKLKPATKKALLTKELQGSLDNLSQKMKLSQTAFKKELNPATGYNMVPNEARIKQLKNLSYVATPMFMAQEISGVDSKHAARNSVLGAALLLAAPGAAARLLSNKAFLSLLAKKKIKSSPAVTKTISNVITTLINS
jgi:hypothetical protein